MRACVYLFYVHKVENWLNKLKDCMVATIRHEFTEAVSAYEEKPREQYLMDFPAQVSNARDIYDTFVSKVASGNSLPVESNN